SAVRAKRTQPTSRPPASSRRAPSASQPDINSMQDGASVLHFFCHNGRVASRLPFNGNQDHAALVPSAQLPPKKILHCGSVRHFSAARLPLCVLVEGIPPYYCEVVSGDAAGRA